MTAARDAFAALHVPGRPLVLWNIWDAGSARAVAEAGAAALATGSLSLAGALGYPDGEAIPLELLLTVVARIRAAVPELPLTVDFESGYAEDPRESCARLAATGAVGLNFEDGRPGTGTIRPLAEQTPRVAAAAASGLFVNARTDLFLRNPAEAHAGLLPEALERARAWAEAGAGCFFVPGLVDPALIARLCAAAPLPVNVMKSPAAPPIAALAAAGVARVSFGPFPWRRAMAALGPAMAEDLRG